METLFRECPECHAKVRVRVSFGSEVFVRHGTVVDGECRGSKRDSYVPWQEVQVGDATNVAGSFWGVYRVAGIRYGTGRYEKVPAMVNITADTFSGWVPARNLENVRRVRRWVSGVPGSLD